MKYLVSRITIGAAGPVEISADLFREAKRARQGILEVLKMEETFNLLCENYYEFERDLLDIRLRNTLFSGNDWSARQNEIFLIERRILNFLSTTRLYLDHIKHAVNSVHGPSVLATLKTRISAQYDAKLGYRVVEAMRNFVQHRGLIIASLSLVAKVNRDDRIVSRTITPSLSVSRIKTIGDFKASVLNELESSGDDTVDLKPLIREAMEGYSAVHAGARGLSASEIPGWEQSISTVRKAYTSKFGEGDFAVEVSEVDDKGLPQESIIIFEDFVKRRRWLSEKNPINVAYSSQVISSGS